MGETDRKRQEDRIKTILFIDESESHRFLLSEELAEVGYKVVTAASPDEALSRHGNTKTDLLILELRQKTTPQEGLERLKKAYSNIPWVEYSTFDQCPDSFKKWIHFYQSKSSEIQALKNLIESLSTQSFRSRNKPSGSRRQKRLSDRGQVHPTHERDEGRNSDE
jgi:DNA-binding NtrC family response regulator